MTTMIDIPLDLGKIKPERMPVGQRYTIAKAKVSDLPDGIALGKIMHEESVYAKFNYDEDKLLRYFTDAVDHPNTFLILAGRNESGLLCGFGAFFCTEHWFGTDRYVCDFGLFVHPDYRKTTLGIMMLKQLGTWANEIGAKEICLGSTTGVKTEDYGNLLVRMGYTHVGGLYKKGI